MPAQVCSGSENLPFSNANQQMCMEKKREPFLLKFRSFYIIKTDSRSEMTRVQSLTLTGSQRNGNTGFYVGTIHSLSRLELSKWIALLGNVYYSLSVSLNEQTSQGQHPWT